MTAHTTGTRDEWLAEPRVFLFAGEEPLARGEPLVAGAGRMRGHAAIRSGSTLSSAAAGARSRLRTSRKVIGIAASATAPQTQNAHWKPPVSAAGAVEPE